MVNRKMKRISYQSGEDYRISFDKVSLRRIAEAASVLDHPALAMTTTAYIRRAMRFYADAVQKMSPTEVLEERLMVEQARRGV